MTFDIVGYANTGEILELATKFLPKMDKALPHMSLNGLFMHLSKLH